MIDRSAFLYMDPKPPRDQFAQCGTCFMFTGQRCLIHGRDVVFDPDDSCGLYVHGEPRTEWAGEEFPAVTEQESGAVRFQVRCENCKYGGGECALFAMLNQQMADTFRLDTRINPKGCCNAFTQRDSDMEKSDMADRVVAYLKTHAPEIAALVLKESIPVGDVHVATALGNEDEKKKKKANGSVKMDMPLKVTKMDPDQQKVFGWASVCVRDGKMVVDKQGDMILPEDIEKAAHDFALHFRTQGDMHAIDSDGNPIQHGRMIESLVFTPDKLEKAGLSAVDPATGEQLFGWFVGFKVDDPALWEMHKQGKRPEFSIGGRGRRVEINVD